MTFPNDFTPEDIDKIIVMNDYNPDEIAIRLGLTCTLYVKNPHNHEVRMRLAKCGDEYLSLFGKHIQTHLKATGE